MTNGMIAQRVRDRLQNELMATMEKFRRLEGEAVMNHLLRNMVQQSDAQLAELGFPVEDVDADLQVQIKKFHTEAEIARAYANRFGKALQQIVSSNSDADGQATIAELALNWKPGQDESKEEAEAK